MSIQDYTKAQKLAEKQYRSDGLYLPVLEEKLRNYEIEGQIPLGQTEIPLSLIEGVAQTERTSAFASNFMPLLDCDTEFCTKWSWLCDSVREVGVNEPIVVFEFMQRFYVAEGNKRVSVSKYFGAVSIGAVVTRVIPKPDDTEEYKVYSEFMAFHRVSGIYEIEMEHPGSFPRLMQAIRPAGPEDEAEDGKPAQPEPWDDDLRRDVKFLYSVFESFYTAKIGKGMKVRAGEAFLHFLEIYGFEQIRGLSSAELHQRIERIRGEFRVLDNENPTSHILNPTEESQKIPLSKMILPVSQGTLKIAFLYPKKPRHSFWVYNHEHGRSYIQQAFGEQIETCYYVCHAEHAEETIERAIAKGCRLIFTTSPVYHQASMRMAVAHPEVIILNCSMNTAYQQLRTYYLRIYEAKYIMGIIAGSMTESGMIGYIADYPVLGTPASIGAFALGVKLVNPHARVFLDWSTLENHDPIAYFRDLNIDLLSDRDLNAPLSGDLGFGLHRMDKDAPGIDDDLRSADGNPHDPDDDSSESDDDLLITDDNLLNTDDHLRRTYENLHGIYEGHEFPLPVAAPVLNWGSLYEDLVRSVLIGAWKNDANRNEKQALNYYWGMSSGAIRVECSDELPSGTRRLVRLIQEQIVLGKYEPFSDEIYDQNRQRRVEKNQSLTPDEIIALDWLPNNVVGRLPEVGELAPKYRAFAGWHSIRPQNSTDSAENPEAAAENQETGTE